MVFSFRYGARPAWRANLMADSDSDEPKSQLTLQYVQKNDFLYGKRIQVWTFNSCSSIQKLSNGVLKPKNVQESTKLSRKCNDYPPLLLKINPRHNFCGENQSLHNLKSFFSTSTNFFMVPTDKFAYEFFAS